MSSFEDDEVRITLRHVWDAQQAQAQMLADMNGKLDRMVDSHDRIDTRVEDHEHRLRAVERSVWALPSAATVISVSALVLQLMK